MSESSDIIKLTTRPRGAEAGSMTSMARGLYLRTLARITQGQLTLREGSQSWTFGEDDGTGLAAEMEMYDPSAYVDIVLGGTVGGAESYMKGRWSSPDLTAIIRVFTRNEAAMNHLDSGLSLLATPLRRLLYALHSNTRAGSRRNIVAHYDLGNCFFETFLDPTLSYSSAYWPRPELSLEQAQIAKIDRLCQMLDLRPEHHLLEIGTGWGYFAIHAARTYGCRVTTTTISDEQYALARTRVRDAGLTDRITVLKSDYRDLDGQYDRLVSVEMIEAVGRDYYDTYMGTCSRLLKPDGRMAIQAITIVEREFERASREVDFIKRYIFPGCCIPSLGALTAATARSGDLHIRQVDDLTPHYARTLRLWRAAFHAALPEVRGQGFSEAFTRMWDFYLAYCEGGFAEEYIQLVQILFTKPGHRLGQHGGG